MTTAFQPNAFQRNAYQIDEGSIAVGSGNGGGGGRAPQTRFIGPVFVPRLQKIPKKKRKRVRKIKIAYQEFVTKNDNNLNAPKGRMIAGVVARYMDNTAWEENFLKKRLPDLTELNIDGMAYKNNDLNLLEKILFKDKNHYNDNINLDMIYAGMATILFLDSPF
jgi:hypothetical protein